MKYVACMDNKLVMHRCITMKTKIAKKNKIDIKEQLWFIGTANPFCLNEEEKCQNKLFSVFDEFN